MAKTPQFFHTDEIPDQDGWVRWDLKDKDRFNWQALGPLKARLEGDRCRLRMDVAKRHTNAANNLHGAATLALIDIALFATMHLLSEGDADMGVTVDLNTQFTSAGKPDEPVDIVVEIIKETHKLLFLRGKVTQENDENIIAAFSGLVKKVTTK